MTSSSKNKISAFTLIELLISLTIISIMAVLSISAYPKFSEQIGVVGETYKIIAYARETQVFGTSAYVEPGQKIAYAFLLETKNGFIKRYIITSPTTKTNDYYLANFTEDTTSKSLELNKNYEISKICTDEDCTREVDRFYAVFRRPNPEARLVASKGANNAEILPDRSETSFNKIYIELSSKKDKNLKKNIVILQTGQMYVKD